MTMLSSADMKNWNGTVFCSGTRYQLTQPEGTWSFWAPEVCSSSNAAGQRFMETVRRRGQTNKAVRSEVEHEGLGEDVSAASGQIKPAMYKKEGLSLVVGIDAVACI